MRIAVVGAGVIGSAVAVKLVKELHGLADASVTLISSEFTPQTTSDKSGSIIIPFDVREEAGPQEAASEHQMARAKIIQWTKQTFQYLDELNNSEYAGLINLQLVSGYYANYDDDGDGDDDGNGDGDGDGEGKSTPWWSECVPGFRHVSLQEMERFQLPTHYKHMYAFSTYILGCNEYLKWIMKDFADNGGIIKQQKVNNLLELNAFDIVINCTGLGANELIKDESVYPVRGDTVIVKAPWIKQFMFFISKDDVTYIFPRSNDVLLGGTKIPRDWSDEPDEEVAKAIIGKCSRVIPSLRHAQIVNASAGLRPARATVRLEIDGDDDADGRPIVIHCYGHGGQGVTLHWGCALDVSQLVLAQLSLQQQ